MPDGDNGIIGVLLVGAAYVAVKAVDEIVVAAFRMIDESAVLGRGLVRFAVRFVKDAEIDLAHIILGLLVIFILVIILDSRTSNP